MAKIKFGMMMTDARGKLGGQVFSKNRSGAYVRTKVTPVNPRTTAQQSNRSLLGELSSSWSGLDEEQRLAWNGNVESWQKTNVFGDLAKPTGKNLFTGLNKNRLAMFPALQVMLLPPSKVVFPPIAITSIDYVSSTGSIPLIINVPTEGVVTIRVRATGKVSAGTTYVKNLLRTIATAYTVPEGGELYITLGYEQTFGALSPGDVFYVEVTQVAENGQLGVPIIARGVAS